jgi:hypothetical protein
MEPTMCLPLIVLVGVLGTTAGVPEVVVLPEKEARPLADQCSRATPPPFASTWSPTQEDVDSLRRHLPELLDVKPTQCCFAGGRLRDFSWTRLQVVGIVARGSKRLIYVNALPVSKSNQWRTRAQVICDGGERYWGVIFDPEAGSFSELAFNGIG